jgi:uncharacterized membrane protein (UPF0127 family)
MQRNFLQFLSVFIFWTFSIFNGYAGNTPQLNLGSITFLEQHLDIEVELAVNQAEREQGLMYRTELAEQQGMLFVYPEQAPLDMWMKNTYLHLDVLFLAADGRIVSLLKNLPPCTQEPCKIYNSQLAALYMLELKAGFIDKYQLKTGQLLRLP